MTAGANQEGNQSMTKKVLIGAAIALGILLAVWAIGASSANSMG